MAAGDILSTTINADGISATIRVAGVGTGGTYLYDAANSSLQTTASAKIVFTVVSKSFDATGAASTVTRTVYGTKTRRVAGSSSLNETVAGSDVDIVVALSEPIYQKDNTGVGNSGTAPTVTFLASWYTKGGTPSNATSNAAVTNNSTLAYAVPFGQWDILPWERQTGSFRVGFTARHYFGIRCVKFTVTGATSAATATSTVTSETTRQRSRTLLYGTAHEATIALTSFTQGENLNLKADIFPIVGDTELDTDDNAAEYVVTGRGPIYHVCDKNAALPVYAVVNASTGNNGTAVASSTLATAEANKFQTWVAAANSTATVIYLETDVTLANRTVQRDTTYWTTTTKHPNTGGTIIVNHPGSSITTKLTRMKFKDVQIKAATSTFLNGQSSDYAAYENCTFEDNGVTYGQWVAYNFLGTWLKDCSFDESNNWKISTTGSDTQRFVIDGCVIPTTANPTWHLNGFWRLTCNQLDGKHRINTDRLVGTTINNCLIEHNEITKLDEPMYVGTHAANTGFTLIGNLVEGVGMAGAQLVSLVETAAFDVDHVLFAHNSIVGERANCFYNDSGTTAYNSRHVKIIGNIFGTSFNTKHDLFGTASANRVGRWWTNYSVGKRANYQGAASLFPGDYAGLRYLDSQSFAFTDDQSGAGTGGGDYTLGGGSAALGVLTADDVVVPYDAFGTAIAAGGALGYWQPLATGNRRRRLILSAA